MNEYDNPFEKEPKKNLKGFFAILGITVIIAIGGIFLLISNNSDTSSENENILTTAVSSKNPTSLLEKVDGNAILDEEVSEYAEFTVNLEAGRYLFSIYPDAEVTIYNREGYPKVKKNEMGDYYFDINIGENPKVMVIVQPRTSTKIMLVQRARFN